MVDRAAQLYDGKQDCAEEANTAKYLAAEASWAAGEACMQTFGGFAFAEEYDIERKWRETRLYQVTSTHIKPKNKKTCGFCADRAHLHQSRPVVSERARPWSTTFILSIATGGGKNLDT